MAVHNGYRGPDIVSDGLVLYLDAGSPNSYRTDFGTTWRDISGNNRNGTLTNGPTFDNGNGGSIALDGSNDIITFGGLDTGDFGLTTTAGATMECWFKWTNQSRDEGVFVFWPNANSNNVDFGWDINPSGQVRVWKIGAGGGDNVGFTSAWSISARSGLWTNYTAVSTSTQVLFYVNGTLLNSGNLTGNIQDNNRNLVFGDHWDFATRGNVSIIKVYNRGLTATEVLTNYNAVKSRFGL